MANTTNFGWETPDDTDLVKDGAAAMRTLGNAIDASLVDLKGGTTGQVLSKNTNTDMDFTWVTTDDANAIQNAIVDAKGDLIAASAADTPARLAVGANGDTLVADSSTATGLRYQGLFGANKNQILNGDFYINQRAFTSNTTTGAFNFDRWFQSNSGGTFTVTPQSFTLGAAPVAGYEGKTFLQGITATQSAASDYAWFGQKIESVRTLAGQTATVSFWAKAASGTPKVAIEFSQYFGSGGSPSASVNTYAGQVTLSTSWARYSVTVAVPSISGKTIGTDNNDVLRLNLMVSAGTDYNARSGSLGVQNNTFGIWGVQVEAGSVATPFQTATGTLAGELAACQRYLPAFKGSDFLEYIGYAYGTNTSLYTLPFNATARVAPTGVTVSGTIKAFALNVSTTVTPTFNSAGLYSGSVLASHTITAGQGSRLQISADALILFTGCEL